MPAEESIIASYQLDITVDHNQFFLEDCEYDLGEEDDFDIDTMYDEDAFARHVGVGPSLLSIFTARFDGVVRLEVIVRRDQPDDILTDWDNVAEVSIQVPSGCILIDNPGTGLETDRAALPHVAIPPDTYRARVYAGGIETVDEYMEDGQDHYRVVLWPAPYAAPVLLHTTIDPHW
jgi:hypothetical protein